MNVERLQHLVDLLRADAANPVGAKFDLGTWAGYDAGGGTSHHNFPLKPELRNTAFSEIGLMKPEDVVVAGVEAPTMSCNTFVCALGLAALDPEFNRQGLGFKVVPMEHSPTAWMVPSFRGDDGMDAGAMFFGISHDDSQYFFDPDCYVGTPKEAEGELLVAQRIEDFINDVIDHNAHPSFNDDND